MTYTKQTWTNGSGGGTPISSARLNHIEDGIETAHQLAADAASTEHAHLSADITDASVTAEANTVVLRDATGGFAASKVTGLATAVTSSAAVPLAQLTSTLATKAEAAHAHVVADLTATGVASDVTFLRGDGAWASPGTAVADASETVKGIVELATTAEATTGTDAVRAVTPAGVKAVGDTKVPLARTIATTAPLTGGGDLSANRTLGISTATTTAVGVVEFATNAEALAGTSTTLAVTPAGVAAFVDQELATVTGADLSATAAYIFQASDGTWPVRSTVTSDSTRVVIWVGYPGLTTPPAAGGSYAVVLVDFYKDRATA